MMIAERLDWVFAVVGWVLAAAGVLAAAWVVRGDRARGRRRCPKCWYDMQGTAGLVCPECGRDARSERRLLKTRRRWARGFIAIALLVMSVAVHQAPGLVRGGWKGAVPNTWLVMMPQDVGAWLAEFQGDHLADDEFPLRTELAARVKEHRLAEWQMGWWVGRIENELRRQGQYGVCENSRTAAEWLDRPLPSIPLKERSVGGIVAALSGAGVPIGVDWDSLLPEQIRSQTPVAWSEAIAAGATARDVLQKMCGRLQEGPSKPWPAWTIVENGTIQVLASRDLPRQRRSAIYRVGDMVRIDTIEFRCALSGTSTVSCSTCGGRVVDDSDVVELVDLITAMVTPDLWIANGGDAASIHAIGTRFIVNAPELSLIEIEGVLAGLRAERSADCGGNVVAYDVSDLIDRGTEAGRRREKLASLRDAIESSIEPDGWLNSGGDQSATWCYRSKLLVRAAPRVQAAVAKFIEDVRAGTRKMAPEERATDAASHG